MASLSAPMIRAALRAFASVHLLAVVMPLTVLVVVAQGWFRQSYLQYALLGSFAIYVIDPATRRSLARLGALAVLLAAFAVAMDAPPLGPRDIGYFLGLSSVVLAWLRLGIVEPSGRRPAFETAAATTLFPLFVAEALLVRRSLKQAQDPTYDLFAYALDGRLGGQVSYWLGRRVSDHPWLEAPVWETYTALPFMLGVLYAVTRRQGEFRHGLRAAILLLGASLLAVIGYRLVPVAGPLYAFPGFPHAMPDLPAGRLPLLVLDPEIERNGVPSLHFAAALLVWWNLRRAGRWPTIAGAAFLFGTLIATLATGEHYLIDLIVTVPFSLALQAGLMVRDGVVRYRRAAVWIGTGLVIIWAVAFRSAAFVTSVPPVIAVGLCVVSIVVPLVLEAKLECRSFTGTRTS